MTQAMAKRGEDGFALIETLVATSLIAAMLAMTYQVIANGAATTRAISDRREAVLVAQSALARSRVPSETSRSAMTGNDGRWNWRTVVVPYAINGESSVMLEKVTVTVLDNRSGRSIVRLSSLRLLR